MTKQKRKLKKDYRDISYKQEKNWFAGLFGPKKSVESAKASNVYSSKKPKKTKETSYKYTSPNTSKKASFNSSKSEKTKNEQKEYKANNSTSSKSSKPKVPGWLQNIAKFFWVLLTLPFWPFFFLLKTLGVWLFNSLSKFLSNWDGIIRLGFTVLFIAISFRLAQLQIPAFAALVRNHPVLERFDVGANTSLVTANSSIILARRGQVFIQDLAQNKNITLTSTQLETNLFFDPSNLKNLKQQGLDVSEVAQVLASNLNLSYPEVSRILTTEIEKDVPSKFVILQKNISLQQRRIVNYLRSSEISKIYNFQFWLGLTEKSTRSYPENTLLSSTIGYTPAYMPESKEIQDRFGECESMLQKNLQRGTDTGEYMVGAYGLEQKYCSELGGLNGKQVYTNLDTEQKENLNVENGANLHLTIDINIQRRAEQILENAIKKTTNENGPPKDGSILVVEAKTGKIRAIASYPYFNPNNYQEYWNEGSSKYNPAAFRNVATTEDYDVGSVMKPLTVAAALNVHDSNIVENGERRGVPASFKFQDYNNKGKVYEELNGNKLYIQNADSMSYQNYGSIGLKEIIRDSVNTGIAEIVDKTRPRRLKEYYEDRFKFGKSTAVDLPGDEHGNVQSFEKDVDCIFCYANFGFGQGFTSSPLQLVRAYTALANRGELVEPYLVEKIEYANGAIDDGTSADSKIKREAKQRVISENTSRLVTSYMQAVVDEGYLGIEPSLAQVPGYSIAGKTGTSEVNRPYFAKDAQGKAVLDENGKPKLVPCDYSCNRERGIYDHTFIGYGPVSNPEFIVLVKISEPFPGQVRNFSSKTVGVPFAEMMEYTLNYFGVPRDR